MKLNKPIHAAAVLLFTSIPAMAQTVDLSFSGSATVLSSPTLVSNLSGAVGGVYAFNNAATIGAGPEQYDVLLEIFQINGTPSYTTQVGSTGVFYPAGSYTLGAANTTTVGGDFAFLTAASANSDTSPFIGYRFTIVDSYNWDGTTLTSTPSAISSFNLTFHDIDSDSGNFRDTLQIFGAQSYTVSQNSALTVTDQGAGGVRFTSGTSNANVSESTAANAVKATFSGNSAEFYWGFEKRIEANPGLFVTNRGLAVDGSINPTIFNSVPTTTTAIPEPSTYAGLAGLLVLSVGLIRRRNLK
jgi:hypothetical protein